MENKVITFIREKRDKRFLHRLERVLANHKIKASPVFDGFIAHTGNEVLLTKELAGLPLSEIRLEIEK